MKGCCCILMEKEVGATVIAKKLYFVQNMILVHVRTIDKHNAMISFSLFRGS